MIRALQRTTLTLSLLLASLSAVFAQPVTTETKQAVLEQLQQVIVRRAFVPGVDFSQLPEAMAKRQDALDKASDTSAFVNTVNTALRDFGISHIRLLSPQSAKTRATGQTLSFGLSIQPSTDGLTITAIAPKSPAEELGLEPGDEIIEVEGQPHPTALAAPPDRETSLMTVRRKRTGTIKYFMLTKKSFSINRPETLTWPTPDTAVLTLPTFQRFYNQKAIEGFIGEVNQKKAKTLVVDLRGNGGGLVTNCVHLLSLLSPPGTSFGTSVTRAMAERYTRETGKEAKDMTEVAQWAGPSQKTRALTQAPFTGKLILLLNQRSASASEITAAVLKEKRDAVLVGRPTAGAVLVSIFTPLQNTGFEVQIPLSDYYSPGGRRLEKNPLQPDVAVDAPAPRPGDDTPDPVLVAALKVAETKPSNKKATK